MLTTLTRLSTHLNNYNNLSQDCRTSGREESLPPGQLKSMTKWCKLHEWISTADKVVCEPLAQLKHWYIHMGIREVVGVLEPSANYFPVLFYLKILIKRKVTKVVNMYVYQNVSECVCGHLVNEECSTLYREPNEVGQSFGWFQWDHLC